MKYSLTKQYQRVQRLLVHKKQLQHEEDILRKHRDRWENKLSKTWDRQREQHKSLERTARQFIDQLPSDIGQYSITFSKNSQGDLGNMICTHKTYAFNIKIAFNGRHHELLLGDNFRQYFLKRHLLEKLFPLTYQHWPWGEITACALKGEEWAQNWLKTKEALKK